MSGWFLDKAPVDPVEGTTAFGAADFGELYSATRDAALYVDNTSAAADALERAYDQRIDAIKGATGVVLQNPIRELPDAAFSMLFGGATMLIAKPGDFRRRRIADFQGRLDDLAKQHPDAAGVIAPGRSLVEDAQALARAAEQRSSQAMASRDDVLAKYGTAFLGGGVAALSDPIQVALLAAGGGPGAARTVAGRIFSTVATEAAVNGLGTAAMQPLVQEWRAKAGLPHGFEEAARNTAFATVLGGAFGLGGSVLGEGARAVFKGRALERLAAEATRDLPPDAPVARAMAGDADAGAEVLRGLGDALPPEARGAVQAMEADKAFRAADLATGEAHDQALADALRQAQDPAAPRAPEAAAVERQPAPAAALDGEILPPRDAALPAQAVPADRADLLKEGYSEAQLLDMSEAQVRDTRSALSIMHKDAEFQATTRDTDPHASAERKDYLSEIAGDIAAGRVVLPANPPVISMRDRAVGYNPGRLEQAADEILQWAGGDRKEAVAALQGEVDAGRLRDDQGVYHKDLIDFLQRPRVAAAVSEPPIPAPDRSATFEVPVDGPTQADLILKSLPADNRVVPGAGPDGGALPLDEALAQAARGEDLATIVDACRGS